jgi:beta-phosphoglucomutase-like phosphatase (HAD superfamily)
LADATPASAVAATPPRAALGPDARESAISHLLARREYRPRPLPVTFAWYGVHHALAFLSEWEPDHAIEAERRVSRLELDAALTAPATDGLRDLMSACSTAGLLVAVFSDLSEAAALSAVQAHQMSGRIAAVAARQGLDIAAADPRYTLQRAADLLGLEVSRCLAVSGYASVLHMAGEMGAIGLGVKCGRDRRKHLAAAGAPVLTSLNQLSHALTRR